MDDEMTPEWAKRRAQEIAGLQDWPIHDIEIFNAFAGYIADHETEPEPVDVLAEALNDASLVCVGIRSGITDADVLRAELAKRNAVAVVDGPLDEDVVEAEANRFAPYYQKATKVYMDGIRRGNVLTLGRKL
jgi:hypothetical protein